MSSTQRVASTGLSSMWIARLFRPLGPLRADPRASKRGPNRARRRCRPSPRIRPRWVLHQDPPAHRSARPSVGSGPVSRSAPRGGLLHRSHERSIGPSAPRTTAEAPRSGPRAIGPMMPTGSGSGALIRVSNQQSRPVKTFEKALGVHRPAMTGSTATEIRSSAVLDTSRSAAAW